MEKIEEVQKEEEEEHFRNPLGVTSDEDGPEGFVRANIIFPGLKKKRLRNEIANGSIDVKFETRSLTVVLTMRNKVTKCDDKYRYIVKQLPDEIEPDKSYHKIKDGQVVLYLKKMKSRSWARELSESGLETFDEGVEDDN